MARKEEQVVILSDDRDNGKIFHLREMPALQAEEWFMRALKLLARSGTEVPPDIFQLGAMGFAAVGIGACLTGISKASWEEAKPLLDGMLECVVGYQFERGAPVVTMYSQILGQIEEARTVMYLRERVIDLHLGFSIREKISEYREAVMAAVSTETGPNTETFVDPSLSPSVLN